MYVSTGLLSMKLKHFGDPFSAVPLALFCNYKNHSLTVRIIMIILWFPCIFKGTFLTLSHIKMAFVNNRCPKIQ